MVLLESHGDAYLWTKSIAARVLRRWRSRWTRRCGKQFARLRCRSAHRAGRSRGHFRLAHIRPQVSWPFSAPAHQIEFPLLAGDRRVDFDCLWRAGRVGARLQLPLYAPGFCGRRSHSELLPPATPRFCSHRRKGATYGRAASSSGISWPKRSWPVALPLLLFADEWPRTSQTVAALAALFSLVGSCIFEELWIRAGA
jgi:hypothetical protein